MENNNEKEIIDLENDTLEETPEEVLENMDLSYELPVLGFSW